MKLFVTASNVRTCKSRVFRTHELTSQVLMASACLPLMFRAVEIDGDDDIAVRPNAFSRLVNNLAANSERYGNALHVEARHTARWLTLIFDDGNLTVW